MNNLDVIIYVAFIAFALSLGRIWDQAINKRKPWAILIIALTVGVVLFFTFGSLFLEETMTGKCCGPDYNDY